jgi:hypothetical protein
MIIEKLLKDTQFKKDAADIARQFAKVGIQALDRIDDAPGLLRSARVWEHSLSEVIKAVKEAANKPESGKDKFQTEITQPKAETQMSEPPKAVGGTKA